MDQKRTTAKPLVHHEQKPQQFEGADDVKSALVTLGYRKEGIREAMEFAAGLPATLTPPERVKAILRRRHEKAVPADTPAATP